jgi:hypothetical protein
VAWKVVLEQVHYWSNVTYELDDWSSGLYRVKMFLFATASRPAIGPTQPPVHWVQRAISAGVKLPGREAD